MSDKFLFKISKYLKGKTAILGIGNILKGDDKLGPLLISRLRGRTKANLFDCGEVPENYVQPIVGLNPETVIIVDAANWGGKPGEIRLIGEGQTWNLGFSTHNASLGVFFDYLKNQLPTAHIFIIGIQIKRTDFMQSMDPAVKGALDKLVDFFLNY